MINFAKAIEQETNRATAELRRTVFLYPDGTFKRAIEWSAWLWCTYIKEFKAQRRNIKNPDTTIVQIGCPVVSLTKYLPESTDYVENEDGTVEITLPETLTAEIETFDNPAIAFEEWKQSCPFVEGISKRKRVSDAVSTLYKESQPATITSVMRQILAFPIERKSLVECADFLSGIKSQLAQII